MKTNPGRIVVSVLILIGVGAIGFLWGHTSEELTVDVRHNDTCSGNSEIIEMGLCLYMDQPPGRRLGRAMWLGQMGASSAQGHGQLQHMLLSDDVEEVVFSAKVIAMSADLSDAAILLHAAQTYCDDERVVSACLGAIQDLLDGPEAPLRVSGSTESLESLARRLHSQRSEWAETTYGEYWGGRLLTATIDLRRDGTRDESQEHWGQVLLTLLMSPDAAEVVPAIMNVVEVIDLEAVPSYVLPGLAGGLQRHLGVEVIPDSQDRDAQSRYREQLLSWWAQNRERQPGEWVLSRLSENGTNLSVAEPQQVIDWICQTIQHGSRSEQHTAYLLFVYLFPYTSDMPILDGQFLTSPSIPSSPERDYLMCLCQSRALFWEQVEEFLLWDAENGRFTLSADTVVLRENGEDGE